MSAVLDHLERQAAASRRLLGIVLSQGEAIRAQDVERVLARLADVQTEMVTRHRLESERDNLLGEAARRLGKDLDDVKLDDILVGTPQPEAQRARELSAEVQGLVREASDAHQQNQILIRQELSFLSHLMTIMSGAPQAGYLANGWAPTQQPAHAVDARA
jgi:hypothetical protein